jgi:hypothetical protein
VTDFAGALDDLRFAVAAATSARDPELRRALATAGFADAEAADLPNGELSHVWLVPPAMATVAELEARFGAAHRLPPRPDAWDQPALVQFDATIPADGETGTTVLAELDGARVVRVTLRRDRF